MTASTAAVRSARLTNAGWFGGALMGAVAPRPSAQEGDTGRESDQVLDTGAVLVVTGAAYLNGARLGEALGTGSSGAQTKREAATRAKRVRSLPWATFAATAGLLVLDADLGEQGRGPAGLLHPASNRPGR